jgi:O-6-methylguanine DNA methyltransferase
MTLFYDWFDGPLGRFFIIMDDCGIRRLTLSSQEWTECSRSFSGLQRDRMRCREAIRQLEEYFSGSRSAFTIPLSVTGPCFHKQVWEEVCAIPYGMVRTYSDIAARLGNPRACRAVGRANGLNPVPIFIPCHRVIGKGGALTGFRGGLTMKKYLLAWEQQGR